MPTIYSLTEQAVTDTPLLLFDCTLPNGQTESWCTHGITVNSKAYAARVLAHSAFEMQPASAQGVDGLSQISIVLANADSHFSEIERSIGWKGARLTVSFLIYSLPNQAPASDIAVLFQGICNPPDEILEATFRLTAINRMNLQRVLLPQVRIQRTCPWDFPATADQRTEAIDGGSNGPYSLYYRCGYSADIAGGAGNLNGAAPYTTCGYTRSDCQARGMWGNFGGIEFVPPSILVRPSGKNVQVSAISLNTALYNDFVPMVYGTAWYAPPIVFARNDGNLTRMQVLLGIGQMDSTLMVLVNEVEIPRGIAGADMTATGWYNVQTLGTRTGAFDSDFVGGDPYGSMAYLSVVVPNQINNGTTLPTIKVLAQGLHIPIYDANGAQTSVQFSNNPAWILLDILRRIGWSAAEIDIPSFAAAAACCDAQIDALDIYGNAISLARFQCNLALKTRKSAGDLARGVRITARLLLTYGGTGLLELRVEDTIANEQPTKPDWSNSAEPLNGGWPNYEFGDGSTGVTGILRLPSGEPSVRVYSRSMADTPNCLSVEFQDALNDFQQDSYAVDDADDVTLCGQEISASLNAIGLPNNDQAGRILQLNLSKSLLGNTYIEFQTSVRSFGVRPGDIITVTYLKEGFVRQPFRILKIAPGLNHRVTTITAQIHDDAWYADSSGQPTSATGGRRQGDAGMGVPRPLIGSVVDANGNLQFGVTETDTTNSDGSVQASVTVSYVPPATSAAAGPGIPFVSLSAGVAPGGTLTRGQVLYYAVSALDSAGNESALSFLVAAGIAVSGSAVTLTGLSFDRNTAAFNVYRGASPAELFRIASGQTIAAQFTDPGLPPLSIAPPDPNFDHANFYWRMELLPEIAATLYSANTVGNATLNMTANTYAGMTARITRGTGSGQEYTIGSNTATTLTVSPGWVAEPDATSYFVVAESGWKPGAATTSATAQFAIPNWSGEVAHITGRAANANNVECDPAISPVTRWQIGGTGVADADVPPQPLFGLGNGAQGGTAALSGIAFSSLTNTRSISSATLTMYYWNELLGTPGITLATAVGAADTTLNLSQPGPGQPGSYLQIDGEVMAVTSTLNGGATYQVTRGCDGSQAAAHAAGQAPVYHLASASAVAAFPPGFFGSPYSGSWTYPAILPDVRVASAELFVTNNKGNSPIGSIALTHTTDLGLRTTSGGQYTIQVDGFLAVDQYAAPALVMDASHAVREIYAVLGTAADAQVQLQLNVNGSPYCSWVFDPSNSVSHSVAGNTLAPLAAGSQVTLSILSVGQAYPGADLTVLIRL
jgi:hypothetical protein